MPYTSGFIDEYEWEDHWERHGADFGARSREEYLDQADAFLGSPKAGRVFECTRPSDHEGSEELLRFHSVTHHFGVLLKQTDPVTGQVSLFILTFYKPRPRRGTALDYYRRECLKRK